LAHPSARLLRTTFQPPKLDVVPSGQAYPVLLAKQDCSVEVEPAEMLAPKGQATAIDLSLPRPEVRVNVEEFAHKRLTA
jgi:hypothetical protein